MVTYYASSSEPASVRGKHVYIQYSNRHEIVNNKGPGDVPGNVLLVTIEGVEAGDVSIDVIHLVSSAALLINSFYYIGVARLQDFYAQPQFIFQEITIMYCGTNILDTSTQS